MSKSVKSLLNELCFPETNGIELTKIQQEKINFRGKVNKDTAINQNDLSQKKLLNGSKEENKIYLSKRFSSIPKNSIFSTLKKGKYGKKIIQNFIKFKKADDFESFDTPKFARIKEENEVGTWNQIKCDEKRNGIIAQDYTFDEENELKRKNEINNLRNALTSQSFSDTTNTSSYTDIKEPPRNLLKVNNEKKNGIFKFFMFVLTSAILIMIEIYLIECSKNFFNVLQIIKDILHFIFLKVPLYLFSFFFFKHFFFSFSFSLIILSIYLLLRKFSFNTKIREIFDKVRSELRDRKKNDFENCSLSMKTLAKRLSEELGIDQEEFMQKFLPELEKLRRETNYIQANLRINEKGKEILEWESKESEEDSEERD